MYDTNWTNHENKSYVYYIDIFKIYDDVYLSYEDCTKRGKLLYITYRSQDLWIGTKFLVVKLGNFLTAISES